MTEQDADAVTRLVDRFRRWRMRRAECTHEPPESEPNPMTLERWERDPTEFAFATHWCAECYKGDLCEYHQEAKQRLGEYNVQ